jgi:peptidoglycan/LPS O-acetylase OafA/YrhL
VKSRKIALAYLPTLDGWRAIAVIAVILAHSSGTLSELGLGDETIKLITPYGRLAVSLFFALSGFLICNQLLREFSKNDSISLKSFYIRRSFRIFPLYFFYLIILMGLGLIAKVPVGISEVVASVFFYRNYIPTIGSEYTGHFWSLAVEAHFYLIFPIFLLVVTPKHAIWLTPIIAFVIHCWRSIDSKMNIFSSIFYERGSIWRTDTTIDAILWGCFAAMVHFKYPDKRLPSWVPFVVLIIFIIAVHNPTPAYQLAIGILIPMLIVSTILNPENLLSKFLELRPIRFIGKLSYSLYIWHVLFLFPHSYPDPEWLSHLKHPPINIVIIFSLSLASYYLIELPMVRLGKRVLSNINKEKEASSNN